jgi:hypothetical protein
MKAKSIDEIVNTFITDLKKTREYKEVWKTIPYVEEITFNFKDRKFEQHNKLLAPMLTLITMDEELLLGK